MNLARSDGRSALVIGGGTMGAGIVQALLSVNRVSFVRLVESDEVALQKAFDRVRQGLQRQHRNTNDADRLVEAAMTRLCPEVGIGGGAMVDLVIEAVPEDFGLKARVLRLASHAVPSALVATNTSSLSVTDLAQSVAADSRFVGLHFFNPVPRSKLVEIVRPQGCEPSTIAMAKDWVDLLGKTSIEVADSPGFATSRLGVAIALEAMRMVEANVADAADIDRGMVLGYQLPIGPLELTDRIGLDVRLAISEHLAATLGPRFEPPNILRAKVASGDLGQKTGCGFYDWSDRK